MQFPNPFKKDKPEETTGDLRIEPQMGNESQAPWDVQSTPNEEEPPAFAVVGDERAKGMPGNPVAQATPSVQSTQSVQPAQSVQATQSTQPVQPAVTKPVVEPARVEPVMSSAKPTVAPAYDPNDAPVLGDSGSAPAPSAPKKPKPVEPEPLVPTEEEAPKNEGFSFGFKKRQPEVEDPDDPVNEELYEQRQRTRYRLVGAAALMVALIVVAPFLLDKEDELPTSNLSTDIPAVTEKASAALETKADPKPDQGSSGDVDVMPSSVDKETSTAKANLQNEARQPVKKDTKAEPKPEPKKEVAKKEQPKPKVGLTAPTGKGYYVQVLATSSERNADRVVRELTNQGLPAYKLPLEQKAGVIWRVRVGLYKTQDEARGVQGTLTLNGHTGKLIVGNQ